MITMAGTLEVVSCKYHTKLNNRNSRVDSCHITNGWIEISAKNMHFHDSSHLRNIWQQNELQNVKYNTSITKCVCMHMRVENNMQALYVYILYITYIHYLKANSWSSNSKRMNWLMKNNLKKCSANNKAKQLLEKYSDFKSEKQKFTSTMFCDSETSAFVVHF